MSKTFRPRLALLTGLVSVAAVAGAVLVAGPFTAADQKPAPPEQPVDPVFDGVALLSPKAAERVEQARSTSEARSVPSGRPITVTDARLGAEVSDAVAEFWGEVASDNRFDRVRDLWRSCIENSTGVGFASEVELVAAANELTEANREDEGAALIAATKECSFEVGGEFNRAARPLLQTWARKHEDLLVRYALEVESAIASD